MTQILDVSEVGATLVSAELVEIRISLHSITFMFRDQGPIDAWVDLVGKHEIEITGPGIHEMPLSGPFWGMNLIGRHVEHFLLDDGKIEVVLTGERTLSIFRCSGTEFAEIAIYRSNGERLGKIYL